MDGKLPYLTASISLSSNTHFFSNNDAPFLNITVISHHTWPITIYAGEISPSLLMLHAALTITDLTTGIEVPQRCKTRCIFEPPHKIEVKLNEEKLVELQPGEPVMFRRPFSRARKPLPKDHPQFEDTWTRRNDVQGVDGLEPGHRYCIELSDKSRVHWRTVRWWKYGTKEEVMQLDENGVGLNAREVMYRRGPHEPLHIDVPERPKLLLECVEQPKEQKDEALAD